MLSYCLQGLSTTLIISVTFLSKRDDPLHRKQQTKVPANHFALFHTTPPSLRHHHAQQQQEEVQELRLEQEVGKVIIVGDTAARTAR